ncbi:MAG: RNase adapter RapZ [Lachnospiraceae bacterium]|nr:RNase adapter RapZ [Lachnospiraceae bacterium]
MKLIFVSGMSGAGKSTALKMLEDMGFFCVDNMPVQLIDKMVQLTVSGNGETDSRIAFGVDIRNGSHLSDFGSVVDRLREEQIDCRTIFLDADDSTLIKRYKETRRTHPLAKNGRVETGIALERKRLAFIRAKADYIIDTSELLTRDLRNELKKIFVDDSDFRSLMVTILSFGFKYGIPADADIVFDVRFLPNPYYIPELKNYTGNDAPVHDYVMKHRVSQVFLDKVTDLLKFLIPNYIEEGRHQLVIAVGCTGGQHRSVTLANEIAARLKDNDSYGLRLEHRDIEKDAVRRRT